MSPPRGSDDRPAQAERVADYLELHPGASLRELDAACDLGSPSKVLSDMPGLGYGIRRAWCLVPCAFGDAQRQRRTYYLTHRPALARQLALNLE